MNIIKEDSRKKMLDHRHSSHKDDMDIGVGGMDEDSDDEDWNQDEQGDDYWWQWNVDDEDIWQPFEDCGGEGEQIEEDADANFIRKGKGKGRISSHKMT